MFNMCCIFKSNNEQTAKTHTMKKAMPNQRTYSNIKFIYTCLMCELNGSTLFSAFDTKVCAREKEKGAPDSFADTEHFRTEHYVLFGNEIDEKFREITDKFDNLDIYKKNTELAELKYMDLNNCKSMISTMRIEGLLSNVWFITKTKFTFFLSQNSTCADLTEELQAPNNIFHFNRRKNKRQLDSCVNIWLKMPNFTVNNKLPNCPQLVNRFVYILRYIFSGTLSHTNTHAFNWWFGCFGLNYVFIFVVI